MYLLKANLRTQGFIVSPDTFFHNNYLEISHKLRYFIIVIQQKAIKVKDKEIIIVRSKLVSFS